MKDKILKLNSRLECIDADDRDELREFREKFIIPKGVTYFLGNSLGVCPKDAVKASSRVIENEWSTDLIESWNTAGWLDGSQRVGNKIAKLIGAMENETTVCDSTSINIFKCLGTSIAIQKIDRPERRVILLERDNFPTDIYITEGFIRLLNTDGYEIRFFDDESPFEENINEDVAVVLISHVNYRSGRLQDMKKITDMTHNFGALIIWDICHSVGSVPILLKAVDADFSVGCTYKYLNCGPGSPGFIWVNKKHHNRVWQPICGWIGHESPFKMASNFKPANGIAAYLVAFPPIIQLSIIECSVDIAISADMELIRNKSLDLGDLFISLLDQKCPSLLLITPRDRKNRGSHLSYQHENSYGISRNLRSRNIIADFRNPNIIRFAMAPLYMSYVDIWDVVDEISDVINNSNCKFVDYVIVT